MSSRSAKVFPTPRVAAACSATVAPARRSWASLIALGVLLALAAGTASEIQGQSGSRYRIGPRDKIQLRVVELPAVDGEVEVGENGTVLVPVVGEVVARGLTEDQLAAEIRTRLESEGLRRATVTVKVTAFLSRPVTVLGAVAEPGNHPIPGQASLLEVLMQAGGPTSEHDRWIEVRRRAENGLSDRLRIDVDDLIARGDPVANIPIFAGDVVHLPKIRQIVIHFVGNVASGEERFPSSETVTLLTAMARIGGLPDAASKKIRVVRDHNTPREREIVVHYGRILSRKDPDIELQDGDLIIVKESFF